MIGSFSDIKTIMSGSLSQTSQADLARALTRRADPADDLVQETLVRAIAKSHLWQAGTDIRAWLFRSCTINMSTWCAARCVTMRPST
jgi:DNA-directed RNA polymerase specialized sigma24 family protein